MRRQGSIIVVGGGLAGLRAAEALREGGFEGRLTLLGEEPHRPDNRPPLSKQVLAGTAASHPFPAEELEVDWRLGTAAVGLDPADRHVALADGSALDYDGLVIATGSRAAPWPGPMPAAGVHTLRGLADVEALERELGPDTRVVIAGAGFLGSELACALRTRGVTEVHLVGRSALPLPGLGRAVGERVAARHREHGVRLHLNTTVDALSGLDRVQQVHLGDGTLLDADVVLCALGAVPNTGWLVVEARRDGLLLGAVTVNAASVHREYQRTLAARPVAPAGGAVPRPSAAPTPVPARAPVPHRSPVPSIGGDHATASGHQPL